MKAYSYRRWSSRGQDDGDSLARQTEIARRIAAERGWVLVDLPPEAATSAWKGKNLRHDAILGGFIRKVEEGIIKTPCTLIVERLDRFSRAEVIDTIPLFLKLIKSGVHVFSVAENFYYTQEALRENETTALLTMTLGFVAANNYSKILSQRVKAAKQRQIKQVIEGERIYLSSSCPYYLNWQETSKKYVPNEKQKIVKRIAKAYLEGKQLQTIARDLNIEKVPCLTGEGQWRATTIRQLLTNKAIIGYFKTAKVFPETISQDDYNRIQGLLERNKIGKGRNNSTFINILRGKLVCAECDGKLGIHKSGNGNYYYRCPSRSRGKCESRHMLPLKDTERFILGILLEVTPEELLTKDNVKITKGVKDLETQALGITKQIQRLVELDGMDIDEVKSKLASLKEQREAIQKKILIESSKVSEPPIAILNSLKELGKRDDVEAYDGLTNEYNKLMDDLEKNEVRTKIRELLGGLVRHIEVDLKECRLKPVYTNGTEGEWADLIY